MENQRWSSEEVLVELDPELNSSSGMCCLKHKTRYVILVLATLCLTSVLSNILTFNFTVICMVDPPTAMNNRSNSSSTNTTFALYRGCGEDLNVTENEGFTSMLTKFMPHDAATAHIHASEGEERTIEQEEIEQAFLTTISKNYEPHDVARRKFHWSATKKGYFFSAIAVGALLAAFPVSVMIAYAGAKKTLLTVGLITAVATALSPVAVDFGDRYFIIARLLQGTTILQFCIIFGSD